MLKVLALKIVPVLSTGIVIKELQELSGSKRAAGQFNYAIKQAPSIPAFDGYLRPQLLISSENTSPTERRIAFIEGIPYLSPLEQIQGKH
jgi:hypothetical protein